MNSTLIYISLMIIIIIIFTISSSNALTLKLTHRDSPQSPLFQPNLSDLQSYLRDIKTSKTRVSYLKKLLDLPIYHGYEFYLSSTDSVYTLNLPIGHPERKTALVMDTTAPLTWMQCKPCVNCFKQKLPIFDPIKSRTYERMNQNHTLANLFTCSTTLGWCYYSVNTRKGQSSSGIVSTERFHDLPRVMAGPAFRQTSVTTGRALPRVVFGCGINNTLPPGQQPGVTGVLGMGNFPTSFVRQLAHHKDYAQFSYCLRGRGYTSSLKIGGDALIIENKDRDRLMRKGIKNVHTTKFLRGPPAGKSLQGGGYRLKLIGISVAGKRLDIPIKSFDSGCIIDTVSPFSVLEERAYRALTDAISGYLMRFKNVKKMVNKKYPKNLCYTYAKGFKNFPGMVWHFEGANLEVNGTNLYLFGKNMLSSRYFCLQMLGSPGTNVLGAYQQKSVMFVFDLDNEELSFVMEHCGVQDK